MENKFENFEKEWLSRVYSLDANNRRDRALDVLYEVIDDLLLEGKFDEVNTLLSEIDLDRLSTSLKIGVLTITLQAKKISAQ